MESASPQARVSMSGASSGAADSPSDSEGSSEDPFLSKLVPREEGDGGGRGGDNAAAADDPLALLPGGIVVLDEGQETNLEMVRLARGKRYFDEGFTPMQQSAVSCWRCGKRGHLARECPRGINERPCHLCAQYGHESRNCPHRLCFKCGRAGHLLEACPNPTAMATAACIRCGKATCACSGKGDLFRYQQGCAETYLRSDVQAVRCLACGQKGHLCCAAMPATSAPGTCCNCGASHEADVCTQPRQTHLQAEKRGNEVRELELMRKQAAARPRAPQYGRYNGGGSGGAYPQQGYAQHPGYGGGQQYGHGQYQQQAYPPQWAGNVQQQQQFGRTPPWRAQQQQQASGYRDGGSSHHYSSDHHRDKRQRY